MKKTIFSISLLLSLLLSIFLFRACSIKGNISSRGEKIYHTLSSRSYDSTVITPSRGERYFCTVSSAERAGFRRAK